MLADRMKLINSPKTSGMRSRANRLKAQGVHVVNFAAGELDLDTCTPIKNAAISAIEEGKNSYTETLGISQLRMRIAESVSSATGVEYQAEEIGVTAGAKQALFNSVMALFQDGDEVIIPRPCWSTFPTQVVMAGAVPVFLETSNNKYNINRESLSLLITSKTKGIILNSPNNPTGMVYSYKALDVVAELAIENDLWVIFDECYASITYPPYKHHNIVSVREEMKCRTIIVNSFSKAYAITGWRIGYVAAPKEIIKAIQKFQGHTTSNPNCIGQHAVLAALEKGTPDFIEKVRVILCERRKIGVEMLKKEPNIHFLVPGGAFYFYIDISEYIGLTYNGVKISSADEIAELLLEYAHIAVVPGTGFGDPNGIRISYAVSTQDLRVGLESLSNFLDKIN